jgi:hypothetical protein
MRIRDAVKYYDLYRPVEGVSEMGTAPVGTPTTIDTGKHVLDLYDQRIAYYWKASQHNKCSYKSTRYLLIVLGAIVTLISSLSSADFIKASAILTVTFAVLTPLLAAGMAIVGGVSQAFQWGAAWSDMVITATRLEKERDRIAVTPPSQLDPVKEVAQLDDLVLTETQGFFQRLFGSGGPEKSAPKAAGN